MGLANDLKDRLLIAVPKKGRLHERCVQLLRSSDIQFERQPHQDIALCTQLPMAVCFFQAKDIPGLVAEGMVDLGVTGQDGIAESEVAEKLRVVCELGMVNCRICVEIPSAEAQKLSGQEEKGEVLAGKRVATSYVNITRRYFDEVDRRKGTQTEIKFLRGSVESACALGLADGVVDLVESGDTMRAAGLEDIACLLTSQVVLIQSQTPHPRCIKYAPLIASRFLGVMRATQALQCTFRVASENLEAALAILPDALVSDLKGGKWAGWHGITAKIGKKEEAGVLDALERAGARDVWVYPLANCRAID
ncbi:uncharacterized protein VTP21DRAFT_4570 [Calcarisporiella thermophila]|uniref:uncharacterized protein n=1 Tax=Calcarisporiella thermophila TaxID=911321 RepID=UPI0037426405